MYHLAFRCEVVGYAAAAEALGLGLGVSSRDLPVQLMIGELKHDCRQMVGAFGEIDRVKLSSNPQCADCILQLWVLNLLEQQSNLGLLCNALSFLLKHVKHLLDLVQEIGKGERLFMLVVK